ncbi:Fc.00g115430.m01.CDS01 [Cosmosporella sp. VM-42]
MDYNTDEIVNAYQSARLRYIRVDESDKHFKAFVPQIEQDPVIQVQAAPTMMKPKGKKDFDSYVESIARSLLGVAICLLPEEQRKRQELAGTVNQRKTEESKETPKSDAEEEEKNPTIIGIVVLGWGGIDPSVAHHRNASIGISLAKPYQNKGYGREAINWMLDWAFKHAGLHSVAICVASYNPRGIHLYQDIGFVLEGRRREIIWCNRGWHDELEFGMTEKEWEILRGLKPM